MQKQPLIFKSGGWTQESAEPRRAARGCPSWAADSWAAEPQEVLQKLGQVGAEKPAGAVRSRRFPSRGLGMSCPPQQVQTLALRMPWPEIRGYHLQQRAGPKQGLRGKCKSRDQHPSPRLSHLCKNGSLQDTPLIPAEGRHQRPSSSEDDQPRRKEGTTCPDKVGELQPIFSESREPCGMERGSAPPGSGRAEFAPVPGAPIPTPLPTPSALGEVTPFVTLLVGEVGVELFTEQHEELWSTIQPWEGHRCWEKPACPAP